MSLREITDDTFDTAVLRSDKPVLVEFWADWCPPCTALLPILDAINTEHGEKLEVVKVDADSNPQLAMRFQITAMPTMKLFRSGEVVQTLIGARSKPALEHALADVLS